MQDMLADTSLPKGGTLSTFMAAVNITKGLVGLGLVALPYATMQVGWLTSTLGMALIAAFTAYGICIGIYTLREVATCSESTPLVSKVQNDVKSHAQESPEIADLGLGPYDAAVARVYGVPGQILCAICIFLGQYATGVAYVDVIAENVQSFFPGQDIRLSILMSLGLLLFGLSCLKTLEGISILSLLALMTYGFIYAGLINDSLSIFSEIGFDPSSVMMKSRNANFGAWFGISQFAFGGFPIVMIVYEDMAEPQHVIKVTAWVFMLTWAMCSAFAVLGYLCYGEMTEDIVYLNFESALFRTGSNIAICTILVLSYVLQMFPCYTCMEHFCEARKPLDQLHYTIVRALVVGSTILVAYLVPSMAVVLDVLGGVAGALTSFVLPALVYMSVATHIRMMERMACWVMVVLGCIGGVQSTLMR